MFSTCFALASVTSRDEPTGVLKFSVVSEKSDLGTNSVPSSGTMKILTANTATAKPTVAERARVPHQLIDICAVTERMDVTLYLARARAVVADITARGRAVLVTGGSGFYLKAFFAPVADEVMVPAGLREEVRATPLAAAVARLRALNPAGVGGLDVANPRRVTRALERCVASGRTLADLAALKFLVSPALALLALMRLS